MFINMFIDNSDDSVVHLMGAVAWPAKNHVDVYNNDENQF
jgi:hypothetical protein